MDTFDVDRRPPCWPVNAPCPNLCAQAHAEHILRNHVELHGPWAGWRLAGRELVSPEGFRLSERRLRGLVWRAQAEQHLDEARLRNQAGGHRGMVTVIRIAVRDWHLEHFGNRAG